MSIRPELTGEIKMIVQCYAARRRHAEHEEKCGGTKRSCQPGSKWRFHIVIFYRLVVFLVKERAEWRRHYIHPELGANRTARVQFKSECVHNALTARAIFTLLRFPKKIMRNFSPHFP